jgi:hypothetical protein
MSRPTGTEKDPSLLHAQFWRYRDLRHSTQREPALRRAALRRVRLATVRIQCSVESTEPVQEMAEIKGYQANLAGPRRAGDSLPYNGSVNTTSMRVEEAGSQNLRR